MSSNKNNPMYRIAEFIVDKRSGFFVLFIVMAIYCAVSMGRVEVENDVAKYLPNTTETRIGVDLMDEEFKTFGTAKILLANITYDRAKIAADGIAEIAGVDTVKFYDPDDSDYNEESLEDYYKDSAALITVMFTDEKEADITQQAIADVRDYVKDYDSYVYTTVDLDESAELQADIRFILGIVTIVIVVVLLFTSETYAEVPIFIATFIMAAILNKGTNYVFGTISFISNAVDIVLQLGLAIDYAIILFHRYLEEKNKGQDSREAMIQALSKAIVEISSSSLTTMAGLLALVFMHFQIGRDLGLVLCKSIVFSMLTVFLFMPCLIMMCRNIIEKSRHKNFVPTINHYGNFIYATRHVMPVLFIALLVFAVYCSNNCPYIFDKYSAKCAKMTDYVRAKNRIDQTFETGSQMAIVIPKGDYTKEKEIIEKLTEFDYVGDITALANVDVGDDKEYVLTDELNPRELAEVVDVDTGLVKLLYTAYAKENEAYGAFIDGIDEYKISVLDMIDYIYEQKEKNAINLSADQTEDLDDIKESIDNARKQLEGEEYSRIVFTMNGEVEGEETFEHINEVREMVQSYYTNRIYLVGDPTSNQDLSASFSKDNTLISALTAFFVGVILLFTFQSASVPFVLLLTIQGSIWINFSIPYLTNTPMYFLGYLIVSSIQMGATVDYAIVITNRYMVLRKELPSRKEAIVASLNQSFSTILTSGTILTACGFAVGYCTSNAVISAIGIALGRGTLTSIILVMLILPQILCICDPLFDRTAFVIHRQIAGGQSLERKASVMELNGHVKGYFSGYIDADLVGTVNGDMKFTLETGKASEAVKDAGK
ncbi:efflux RND transporter permease subunit [Lachnospiraceae bacterium C1.1]|nr:MMPL family transporter [Lachnospiraceae bacterium C1.1]